MKRLWFGKSAKRGGDREVASDRDKPADNDAGDKAMEALGRFTDVTVGLATGALAFGVGLIGTAGNVSWTARALLECSGACFVSSIGLCVFLARANIVSKIYYRDYSLHARAYNIPMAAHQVSFFLGIMFLAASLWAAMNDGEQPESAQTVDSAQAAVECALARFPRRYLAQVRVVETVKGTDQNRPGLTTWHVQLVARPALPNPGRWSAGPGVRDVFVTGRGVVTVAQQAEAQTPCRPLR
jgi:hypothetical protein